MRTDPVLLGRGGPRKAIAWEGTSFVLGEDLICPRAECTPPSFLPASRSSSSPECTHAHLCPLGLCDCQEGALGRLPGE